MAIATEDHRVGNEPNMTLRPNETATLTIGDRKIDIPIVTGTEGERALDIATLRRETGLVTIDPGYMNTGSCTSKVTFLDGEAGILRYRGIPIEQLATSSSYMETAYLLIYGDLPTKDALDDFRGTVRLHTLLHEDMKRFYDGFPRDAHPMAILSSAVSALSTFYQGSHDHKDPNQVEISIIRLMAKLPTIAAYAYKKSIGQPFLYPDNSLTLAENFRRMMFGVPAEPWVPDPEVSATLELLLILHADHEQNCSTSTVRLVGSSQANLYASIAAGINALWGRLHGGANQAVIEMLKTIQADGGDAEKYVMRAKDPDDSFRLMGFGHRVYKNFDPRATIIKDAAQRVLGRIGANDELLAIARRLEEIALQDDYFIERKLYPNVDFYSGLIYRAMGFPTPMFPVLFAIGRLPGWIAQWKEMVEDPNGRLGRPRQIYMGRTITDYVPLGERG